MYLALPLRPESELTQQQFCDNENLSPHTFKYWYKKYRKEKCSPQVKTPQGFIPVKVDCIEEPAPIQYQHQDITITYPNGVEVKCPLKVAPHQLKALLNL